MREAHEVTLMMKDWPRKKESKDSIPCVAVSRKNDENYEHAEETYVREEKPGGGFHF